MKKNILLFLLLVPFFLNAQQNFPTGIKVNTSASIDKNGNITGNGSGLTGITASQVGALASGATAVNSGQLQGKDSMALLAYSKALIATKQATLVSGTNIKTINSQSLLGSGNIDITSGGSTIDTFKIIYNVNVLGSLYAKNTWSDLTDFTNVGSPTVSVSSNKIALSGGNQNPSFTLATTNAAINSALKITSYGGTMLERWKMTVRFKVNTTPGMTTYGIGCGVYGINATNHTDGIGFINLTTSSNAGKLILLIGPNITTSVSATALTFSQNDYINLTTERIGNVIQVTAMNNTTSQSINYCKYIYDQSTVTGGYYTPNTSNFVITNQGGSFLIDSVGISSDEIKGSNILMLGDSKFSGYSTPFDNRIAAYLNKYYPGQVIVSAGQSDKTADVIAHINEVIALNPKQVLLCIGRNDVYTSVPEATWQANLSTIVSTLEGAGIKVILVDGIYETLANQTALLTYIRLTYPTKYVSVYDLAGGSASYVADQVHPNIIGAQLAAEVIYKSGKLTDKKTHISQITAANPESDNVTKNIRYFGTLKDIGAGTIPNLINTGDYMMRADGAIVAASVLGSQKARFIPLSSSSNGMEFRTYTGNVNNYTYFHWYTADATSGNQVLRMQLTNRANLKLGGALNGANLADGDLQLPNAGGISSCADAGVGNNARIIPYANDFTTEFRNYKSTGTHKFYVSGGIDGNQILGLTVNNTGNIGINNATPAASSALDVVSTIRGFLPPRMTTIQKNAISSPEEGLIVYDLTLHKLCIYTGSAWETITSL
jgi:hypothetical protein